MGEFKVENGTSLEEAVFTALGAASVCWEFMEGTGEFQSVRAKNIGEELVAAIRDGRIRDGAFETKVSRWQPLGNVGDGSSVDTAPAGTPPPRSPGPDLGDDPDGDVEGYDGP